MASYIIMDGTFAMPVKVFAPDFWVWLINRDNDSQIFLRIVCIDNMHSFRSRVSKKQKAGVGRIIRITFDDHASFDSVLYFLFRDTPYHAFA